MMTRKRKLYAFIFDFFSLWSLTIELSLLFCLLRDAHYETRNLQIVIKQGYRRRLQTFIQAVCQLVRLEAVCQRCFHDPKNYFMMSDNSDMDCADAEALIKYTVSLEDLETYQKLYQRQVESAKVNPDTKFQYAWCLVHSRRDITKQAIPLLEELFREGNEQMKRDCLFYLTVAHAKLKNYVIARRYVESFLSVEPSNSQAQHLQKYISKNLKKDGLTGMAIVGGAAILGGAAAVAIGAAVLATGAGMAVMRAIRGKPKDDNMKDEKEKDEPSTSS